MTTAASQARDDQATRLEAAADALEFAVQHLRTAATYFRDDLVPRACAHTLAAEGHVSVAQRELDEVVRRHAAMAEPRHP